MKSEMFQDAIEKANEAAKPVEPPVTSMRIDKLKDGGFVVGNHTVGGTFASRDIGAALNYIAQTLDPRPVAKPEDVLKAAARPGGVISVSSADAIRTLRDHGLLRDPAHPHATGDWVVFASGDRCSDAFKAAVTK
jgi:hypothetical protein